MGGPDERRCVEWIYGALMINVVSLCLFAVAGFASVPLVVAAVASGPGSVFHGLFRQLFIVLGWSVFPALLSAPLLFVGALAASILYRGTIDPRLVVGRFTLWGMLGLIITFIFVLVERAVALQLVVWFDLPPQTGALAAGAAVAASFQPIRRRAERWSAAALVRLMPPTALMGGTVRCGAVAVTRVMALVSPSAIDDQGPLLASALVQREAHRVAEQHGGRFVRFTADGVLMHFAVAVQALRAVQELHHAIGVGSQVLNLNQADVCTGLHWGDFVETQDGDLLGQTLLTAIRISGEANPGDIHRSPAFDLRLAAEPDQARLGAA
jgi:class 3 adenylate cyclase